MLPENKLSTSPALQDFLPPADRPTTLREDLEMGGIAHQDPSRGLMYQVWRAWLEQDGWIHVQPENKSRPAIRVVSAPGALYVSLAFDRNMRMVVAWQRGAVIFLHYFDTISGGYITTNFTGCRSPRLTHDDKRDAAGGWSDVIFMYAKGTKVCVRNQRERYGVEHELGDILPTQQLAVIGMTKGYRVRVDFR